MPFNSLGLGDGFTYSGGILAVGAGDGIARTAGLIYVDSQEAHFFRDGGTTDLTCGGTNYGAAQVMDDGTLQWCDGQGTPAIRHSAFVDTNGAATNLNSGAGNATVDDIKFRAEATLDTATDGVSLTALTSLSASTVDALALSVATSGTPAAFLGLDTDWYLENASGTEEGVAALRVRWDSVTANSEEADVQIYAMNNGETLAAQNVIYDYDGADNSTAIINLLQQQTLGQPPGNDTAPSAAPTGWTGRRASAGSSRRTSPR